MSPVRVGYAFERLGRSAGPTATGEMSAIVYTPPRDPCTEDEVATVWRCVVRWRRGDSPVRFCVSESTAGVILCLNGKIGFAADKMRRFAFNFGRHLEFRSAKFLNLKLMRKAATRQISFSRQIDSRISEVRIVRECEFEIERTVRIEIPGALRDLIVSRILDRPRDPASRVTKSFHVAQLARRDATNVTLYGDLLFWPVHLAVVEHEPTQRIALGLPVPGAAVLPVVIRVFRKKRDVVATSRDQHRRCGLRIR